MGAAGGAVYWIGAQFWPTSVAVVLSMLATALLSARFGAATGAQTPRPRLFWFVFAVLLKYNVLMALSAAGLPFPLPAESLRWA